MTGYDNNMTGVLFRNEKKEKDSQPDYRGSVEIHGEKYKLAGWIRVKKSDGKKFLSLKIEEEGGGDYPGASDTPNSERPF